MTFKKLLAKAIENWPVKVLSIGLAIVLFIFHRMSLLEERFFSVPLIIEQRSSLMPSSPYPTMIRVSLRGEANSIYPILEEDIEVYADLGAYVSPGTYNVPVQWRKKGTAANPAALQITVDPIEFPLTLDHKISKFVPLSVNLRGQVEPGHVMTSYTLEPPRIIIDGPAGLMISIASLNTAEIDLDGRNSDFSVSVNIINPDPLVILRGDGTTQFHGIISRLIPVRNITNVPIALTNLAEGLGAELEVKAGSLHLEGGTQDVVDRFMLPPNFLWVDCSGISEPGTFILELKTGNAGNIRVNAEPREVAIRIGLAGGDE